MNINRSTDNGVSLLTLSGNLLGEKDSTPIIEAVETALSNDNNLFVFDLKDLKYINSTGLSVLITTLTKSRNANGNMCIVNLPDQLSNLLNITKLDKVFPTAANYEAAVKLLKA